MKKTTLNMRTSEIVRRAELWRVVGRPTFRDYKTLYKSLKLGTAISYRAFPRSDFSSRTTGSFRHALLTSVKR